MLIQLCLLGISPELERWGREGQFLNLSTTDTGPDNSLLWETVLNIIGCIMYKSIPVLYPLLANSTLPPNGCKGLVCDSVASLA